MGEKLVVGPFNRGLRNDRPAFMIDNESFPTLINAYQWRGRVKRKRGTQFICRLQRFFNSTISSYKPTNNTIVLVAGAANILTGFATFQTNAQLVPGSITIIDITAGNTYTDNSLGILTGVPAGTGTVNYATGTITITGGAGDTISASFSYYPILPVLGLEELILQGMQFPGTMAFDTTYSYEISTAFPYTAHSVSFYKNPSSGTYPGYIQKTNWTPVNWNSQDYQQVWTVNYQGALWATNGITVPFTTTNIGMQFKPITAIAITAAGPPAIAQLTIAGHGLVVGDFLFINEVANVITPPSGITGINFQTGYVIAVIDANNVSVEFPNATLGGVYSTGGIAQYLTSSSDPTKDTLRYYDGDPTNGSSSTPTFLPGKGWVNFSPPLSEFNFSIATLVPQAVYYLVGARGILPFKDRLVFFGPVIQTSTGVPIYLQDAIVFSQNGTPYYTVSFSGSVFNPTTPPGFVPILVPTNQTATPSAYWEDQTGFGGSISAGIDRAMTTFNTNEDALIVGFDPNIQTRIIYSGNDLQPFNFFLINSELGSSSTFSAINMDYGVITKGNRAYVVTSQTQVERIDLEIPDQVFETKLTNNGTERVTAQRDFINEWIYFTYPSDQIAYRYPTQTLQYNYRDRSWGIFFESYTTYGSFRKQTGFTWATVGNIYPTWNDWNEPWDAGESELLQPLVIGGNQQGFVLGRGVGTGEGTSLFIEAISGSTITSPDHCLNTGDYIVITGALGTVDPQINSFTFQITVVDNNNFTIEPNLTGSFTYLGGGLITRIYVPLILTKQFPVAWEMARKTRLGPQQYLFTTTQTGQITLQIYLSQNSSTPYNGGPIVPSALSTNNTLIYSQILYTCPESTNLGLVPISSNMSNPANTNLQIVTAGQQAQTWHRMNTSLIGDTVQIGFTLSVEQISGEDPVDNPIVITGITQANPAVLTVTPPFNMNTGSLVEINGVLGMIQLNGNVYVVSAVGPTSITIDVNSTFFSPYMSGGTVEQVSSNAFSEIELHGFILDVQPSQLLV
jgi:hypothetical protein